MSRTRPVSRLLSALFLWATACGGNSVEATRLVLTVGSCDLEKVTHVHSVQVLLQPTGQQSECLAIDPKTLEGLQAGLTNKIAFRGLDPGDYTLTIRGYDDKACRNTVLVCGLTSFGLPAPSATITVPVDCYGGPAPPPSFARCAGK